MEQVSVVGLDLAKSVFQVHGVNAQGEAGCGASFPAVSC